MIQITTTLWDSAQVFTCQACNRKVSALIQGLVNHCYGCLDTPELEAMMEKATDLEWVGTVVKEGERKDQVSKIGPTLELLTQLLDHVVEPDEVPILQLEELLYALGSCDLIPTVERMCYKIKGEDYI